MTVKTKLLQKQDDQETSAAAQTTGRQAARRTGAKVDLSNYYQSPGSHR